MGRAVPISVRRANWMAEMRKHAARRCEIVSEILDIRTKNLFAETQCCDYVLSNELMSKTLAMVSEDRLVNLVLKELFSTQGNDIFIRKSADYVFTGEELSFFEVQTRCRHRGEVRTPGGGGRSREAWLGLLRSQGAGRLARRCCTAQPWLEMRGNAFASPLRPSRRFFWA